MKLKMGREDGFVLPLIFVIFLCLGICVASMFYLPMNTNRVMLKKAREMQCLYNAESSIVASLAGFPDGYFQELPVVKRLQNGPYGNICAPVEASCQIGTKKICVSVVERFRNIPANEWMRATERYRKEFHSHIVLNVRDSVSGNKRFFRLPAFHSLRILNGDLLLDAPDSVRSAAYLVDGNVTVKGTAFFDTLRIYSRGIVSIGENVAVNHLEVVGTEIELVGNARVRGLLLASRRIECSGRAEARFPSFAVALGSGIPEVLVINRALLEGAAVAPGGNVIFGGAENKISDSSKAALPTFFDGDLIVFGSGGLP